VAAVRGGIGETTLHVNDMPQWTGGEFWIAYDPTIVEEVTSVEATGIAEDFELHFHDMGNGLLRFAISGSTPAYGNGPVALVSFRIKSNVRSGISAPIALVDVSFNDVAGRDFATSAIQQTIEREDGLLVIRYVSVYLPLTIKQ
jgi:hypothetical protein